MNIKEMIDQLNNEIQRVWKLYHATSTEFDTYVDRQLTDHEAEQAHKAIIKMQMTYDMLHPAFNYIASMNDFSLVAMDEWKKFAHHINDDAIKSKNAQAESDYMVAKKKVVN